VFFWLIIGLVATAVGFAIHPILGVVTLVWAVIWVLWASRNDRVYAEEAGFATARQRRAAEKTQWAYLRKQHELHPPYSDPLCIFCNPRISHAYWEAWRWQSRVENLTGAEKVDPVAGPNDVSSN
jgi:hypothetical protein